VQWGRWQLSRSITLLEGYVVDILDFEAPCEKVQSCDHRVASPMKHEEI